jgi:hypothetical protein
MSEESKSRSPSAPGGISVGPLITVDRGDTTFAARSGFRFKVALGAGNFGRPTSPGKVTTWAAVRPSALLKEVSATGPRPPPSTTSRCSASHIASHRPRTRLRPD